MAWYRCGGGGLPAGLQSDMDTVFNKKFSTSTTYPPTDWPDTVNLMGPLPEKTASGAIANITDGADGVPLKNWLVTLPASMDGYTSIGGNKGGANFAELSNDSNPNKNAFTYTTLTPAKIEWEKTLSGGRFIVRFVVHIPKAGSYTFSEKNNTGGLYIYSDELWGTAVASNKATPYTHTFSTAGTYVIGFYNSSAIGTTGTLEEIACSYGSTADAFSVYTAPTTATASLGRTIYGGTADIVTGEGEDGYIKYVIDGVNNYAINVSGTNFNIMPYGLFIDGTISKWVCDALTASSTNFGYNSSQGFIFIRQAGWSSLTGVTDVANFNAYCQNNPITLILPKTTADDFSFTPITPTPETALGVNNFWADEGDSDVTYRADISLALQALGGGGRGLMMMRPPEQEETEETEGLEDELNR